MLWVVNLVGQELEFGQIGILDRCLLYLLYFIEALIMECIEHAFNLRYLLFQNDGTGLHLFLALDGGRADRPQVDTSQGFLRNSGKRLL